MSDPKSVGRSVDGWLRPRPGEQCLIRVPAAETGGKFSVVEVISDPGNATPWHVHKNEDEYYVVLEGVARIAYGDRVMDAKEGDAIMLPRCVPHAWGNRSDRQLRLLAIAFPGGAEEVLRLAATGEVKDIPALAERFGVTILGPAPF